MTVQVRPPVPFQALLISLENNKPADAGFFMSKIQCKYLISTTWLALLVLFGFLRQLSVLFLATLLRHFSLLLY